MKVIEIIKLYLKNHGYDGLYNSYADCACLVDDLAPCGEIGIECKAGYKVPCDCGEHGFHIQEKKVKGGNIMCSVEKLHPKNIKQKENSDGVSLPEQSDLLTKQKDAIINNIMKQRERIIKAFIAETGLKPSECEQVLWEDGGKLFWYVRKRS